MRETKEMEFEDAPSGFVKLYNYKEPFMSFKDESGQEGYGFQGVLLFDGETDKVQCHFCGDWFGALVPHINREYNLTAKRYKEIVGLRQSTALISESMRAKLIASGLNSRLANLRPGTSPSEETRKKISETLKKNTRESQNEKGTCPMQLLDRLRADYEKLGHTPSSRNYGLTQTLRRVYGSYPKACEMAGIPVNAPGRTHTRRLKYTKEYCVQWMANFFRENGRLPMGKENKQMFNSIRNNKDLSIKEIKKEALVADGKYRKVDKIVRYNKEQLLTFLRRFEEINGRKPSYSDCKRGLLPHLSRYSYNFGSWKNALKLAFNA